MDAVSDVLRVVRLGGAVYLNGEFTAPWCTLTEMDSGLCASFLPRSERVVSFHLVTEGRCWAWLASQPDSAIEVSAGELLVIPQGEEHILGSALALPPVPAAPILAEHVKQAPGEVMQLSYGGGGNATRMVCGFLASPENHHNPIISSLPRLFKVDVRNDPRSTWLETSLRYAASEAAEQRSGSSMILGKLSELLFVEAIRRYIDTLPEDQKGWLAGMRDRFVGRSLSILHAQPAHAWTVDELALKVGLSRSALAQRFTELLDQPPMQYLAHWRMQLAAYELVNGKHSIAAIAEQVGYDSEAAFNRAFKREFGMPPGSWRKQREKNGS